MSEPVALEKGLIKDSSKKESTLFWNLYVKCQDSLYNLMPYRKLLWDCLQELDLKPGMRILNAGSGTGHFETFAVEKGLEGIEIHALESSPTRLKLLNEKTANLSNVKTVKSNLNSRLPYEDNYFDSAICINVISFLENPNKLLNELKRVVKPQGRIVISKPKINFKNFPIAAEHISRFKNIRGFNRQAKAIVNTVRASSFIAINPLLSKMASNKAKKSNGFSEKDLVGFARENNLKGTSLSPAYAYQNLLANVKQYEKEELIYPIRFKVAETKEELEEACKLRFKVYCQEKGYLEPQEDCLGIERDEYDASSVHFIALDGYGKVIATNRLILDSKIGMPINRYFDIKPTTDTDKAAEISRLIIKANGRSFNHKIALGLYKLSYDYSIANGITHWYAILDDFLLNNYQKKLKFVFHAIGQRKDCLGGLTAPYVLDIKETMANLKINNNQLYTSLKREFSGYFHKSLLSNHNDQKSNYLIEKQALV